ncbi:RNA polymerase sigma factor [Pararhizobium gei]|uniref:RNA polymerase sigma factor n=1 Tax=Pararhizobium gei TaxID=1395951 RepID=UPI0023DCE2E4|nr:sigma factor-like helix-turn-helix DNA-binding protein [Rhizobium gei]
MHAEPAFEEPDVEARLSGRSGLALARKGILDLPRRQRMALLLRAVADLDVAEIAQVMGAASGPRAARVVGAYGKSRRRPKGMTMRDVKFKNLKHRFGDDVST